MNKQSDYFAELYVAGKLADAGWNVYFPHRDRGFDFVISKPGPGGVVIRPVQVKGKYPTDVKTNKLVYGYVGRLTEVHPQMLLAIPYFRLTGTELAPVHIAYMPYRTIKKHKRGFRCQPASFTNSIPVPRRDFRKFFDDSGITFLESKEWDMTN